VEAPDINRSPGAFFMFRFIPFVAVFIITTLPVFPQDKSAEVDKIFAWAKSNEPGCSIAFSQNGKLVVSRGYGSADLERDVPITANTVFDAGSIRKQFVAAAVLLLAEDGKLSLSDDVRKYIPELPDYGHKIMVDHLLTHTSGIRDWQPLLNLAGGDPDAMTMILRQRELNFVPGDEWSYSNSGYVLLPEIVKRVTGMPFSEFARKRIFEPLGMKSTSHPEDPLYLIKNRALAYSKDAAGWKMDMYLGNQRGGAGGLFTTAVDLVTWNDALANGRLGTYVTQKLQEPAKLNNGRKLSYTRGLFVESKSGEKFVWHTGGAAGYSARSAFLPESKLSLALMCNSDGGARETYANQVFDLFLLPGQKASSTSPATGEPPTGLNARAGLYFDEQTGEMLRLAVNNNTLVAAGGGPLLAVAPDLFRTQRQSPFFMSEAEVEIHFLSADQFEIKTKEGEKTRYRRASGWKPTQAELLDLVARYRSEELTSVFEARLGKEGLMIQVNDSPRALAEFNPVARDTFLAGGSLVRFTRDSSGKVIGLDYSNPVLRKVKFIRQN
jgi:CubicO group peptidase (beta-lactamase class C family)